MSTEEVKIEVRYTEIVGLARSLARSSVPDARSTLYDLSRRLRDLADDLGEQLGYGFGEYPR